MSARWFSSDLHFTHRKQAERRGFSSAEEHDEYIIGQWNKCVRPDDVVWITGDVGVGSATLILAQAARLNGRKQLVTGNHDTPWPGNREGWKCQRTWLNVFESVQPFAHVRIKGVTVLLSHFPYKGDHTEIDRAVQYRLRDEGLPLIHGHTHSADRVSGPGYRQFHVGVDAWDLKPVSEVQLTELMRAQGMFDVPEPSILGKVTA